MMQVSNCVSIFTKVILRHSSGQHLMDIWIKVCFYYPLGFPLRSDGSELADSLCECCNVVSYNYFNFLHNLCVSSVQTNTRVFVTICDSHRTHTVRNLNRQIYSVYLFV